MFRSSNSSSNNLEYLVRTALSNGEVSPGIAVAIQRYCANNSLSTEEKRYMAILEDAINDGCIHVV